MASDLLQRADDSGAISGNGRGAKPLAVKRKARKSAKTGVEVENGSCPVSLHHSVKMRHLLS